MIEPLTILDGLAAALPLANVDTDMILAAQFMKTTSRRGLGRHLFHALRHNDTGKERVTFVLDQPPWDTACFLVTLDNFGCGSSREHAPWALLDFGIRCVIAPSFADIFSNNCTKNGILPLTLERSVCDQLIFDAALPDRARLRLDLPNQLLIRANGEALSFDISDERKQRLVEGLDDIERSFSHEQAITAHEAGVGYPRPCVPIDLGQVKVAPCPL